ncbi:MAG TPA: FtsX-like permease family protein [Coxiellaceae bacterium]|nr:FtsX-like permease family protein [Coxiellaceae bacterium]
MKILDVIRTANSNLKRNKLRTGLTISAVVIGAMTLSLTNGIGNGVKSYINQELKNVAAKDSMAISKKQTESGTVFGGELQEYKPGNTREFGFDYLELSKVDEIKKITGAKNAYPIYQVTPEYVTAGETKYLAQMTTHTPGLELGLLAGSLLDENDGNMVMLPKAYSEAFFQQPANAIGKEVTLAVREPGGELMEKSVVVKAVLEDSLFVNNSVMGSGKLMANLNAFQTKNIVEQQNKVQTLIVRLPGNVAVNKEKVKQIQADLDKNGFRGDTIENQIGSVNDVISSAQLALNLFGAIALLAATFGIVNTLLMAVYERTKEIGLLKALGLSRKQVFAVFALEAMSIGFWGGLIGVGLSMLLGMFINNFATSTIFGGTTIEGLQLLSFPISSIVGVIGVIMIISFIAGVIPSAKASRLNPIDALRYE